METTEERKQRLSEIPAVGDAFSVLENNGGSALIPIGLSDDQLMDIASLGYTVQTFKAEFQNTQYNGGLEGHKISLI